MRQTEHQFSIQRREPERTLRQPCCQPLARQLRTDHRQRHDRCTPAGYHQSHVNHHTDAQQEQRHEDRISYEVDPTHQRREVRHPFVQRYTAEERTEDTLQPCPVSQAGTPHQHQHHHRETCRGGLLVVEEPLGYHRERTERHRAQQCGLACQRPPVLPAVAGKQLALQYCQHKQRQGDRQHRRAHRHVHCGRLLHTVTVDDRIRHQRMTAKHRAQQRTRLPRNAHHARDEQSHHEREKERI